ncbi:hypothetical protein AVEN_201190-1 [Araneus ventricosus]|uniref:Uncharacterized protein n=1 Tax=Araneus ventricosus TaxID=182803 RepID=A0A4Y2NIY0_ARAVE|nr:hypothetical protein AVEN_196181-1 [Araneus ventricosus]GBN37679.1 hypothetical protein AVEN_236522-1 [Araneus ventricosus]GBN37802.1 hypothetical protein AVEN_137884-1 [Araneus ventricosus]GBN37848.1 hypothetical protein AVEN_201190-1 [Araneus ventricosus]
MACRVRLYKEIALITEGIVMDFERVDRLGSNWSVNVFLVPSAVRASKLSDAERERNTLKAIGRSCQTSKINVQLIDKKNERRVVASFKFKSAIKEHKEILINAFPMSELRRQRHKFSEQHYHLFISPTAYHLLAI